MIIVDDHVSIALLGDRSIPELAGEPMATTWGFHFRLLRALALPRAWLGWSQCCGPRVGSRTPQAI